MSAARSAEITDAYRRQAIALAIRDVLEFTDPHPANFNQIHVGLTLLIHDAPIREAEEECWLEELLRDGWYLAPATDPNQ